MAIKRLGSASFEKLTSIYGFSKLVKYGMVWENLKDKVNIYNNPFPFEIIGLSKDVKLSDEEWSKLLFLCHSCYNILNYPETLKEFDTTQLESAELIAFLRSVKGSEIKLCGTINKPMKGERKGDSKNVTICSSSLIDAIEKRLINEISIIHADNYSELWLSSVEERNYDVLASEFKRKAYYSDEAIQRAIRSEKAKKHMFKDVSDCAELGALAETCKKCIDGVIKEKVTQTKVNCFIYDLFTLFGLVSKKKFGSFIGDVPKEKSDKVKYWIKSWYNYREKHEKPVKRLYHSSFTKEDILPNWEI